MRSAANSSCNPTAVSTPSFFTVMFRLVLFPSPIETEKQAHSHFPFGSLIKACRVSVASVSWTAQQLRWSLNLGIPNPAFGSVGFRFPCVEDKLRFRLFWNLRQTPATTRQLFSTPSFFTVMFRLVQPVSFGEGIKRISFPFR